MKNPVYLQIYTTLRNRIVIGAYPFHTYLPSKRVCAREFNASIITVEHALQLLEEEGYVEGIERKGYLVVYQEADFFAVSDHSEMDLIPTSDSNPIQFPSSVLAKTIRKIVSMEPERILVRGESTGLYSFRLAISSYLARSRDIYVSPEQIIIGAGSEFMYSLLTQLIGKDQIYAIEDPCYEKIEKMYQSEDVALEKLKMGKNGIFTKELQHSRANVLHVTPVNSFPSQVTADIGKRREYVQWAKQRNGIIIEDDYASEYSTIHKPEETLFSMEPAKSVFYLNSFTRTIGSGLRISYVILPNDTYQQYLDKIDYQSCTVSTLEQLIVTELLNNGSFERHLNRIKRKLRAENSVKEM